MGDLVKHLSSRIFHVDASPASTVSIKVQKKSLLSAVDSSVRKRDWLDRNLPVGTRRRVNVEAAEGGTNDSIFFAPERPNVNQSHERVSATEFIKIDPNDHNDVVRIGDDFEISFCGMSVATQDLMGDNELLLCSLARKEDCLDHNEIEPEPSISAVASSTIESSSSTENKQGQEKPSSGEQGQEKPSSGEQGQEKLSSGAGKPHDLADEPVKPPLPVPVKEKVVAPETAELDLSDLPTALPIRPGDLPFLHFDPETDGHDVGSEPDTFVAVPGTKRLFVRRRGSSMDMSTSEIRDVVIRFTVMEIDKLSEDQLIAVKSLEEVAKSVGKAANSVPYLKFISWLLKFANTLGRSALKKVAKPDHVMSMDINFILAPDDDSSDRTIQREEYGNYLRYGYYYFLSGPIDAKLYAQTGASSQNVQLLLKRHGYSAKSAKVNEKEYFPLAGMSYVVVKVTRGCSPYNQDERSEMFARHRARLFKILKKYTGTLGSVTADAAAADEKKKGDEEKSAGGKGKKIA